LAVSSECHKILATLFQEFDDTDVFGASAACDEFVSFSFESDSRFPESFGQTTRDESDNTMFDIGGIIEENSLIPINHFHGMFDEVFCRRFPFGIEIFEFREDGVEFVFSGKQERKRFVWAIHSTRGIDAGSHKKTNNIRIHFLVSSFDEFPKSTRVTGFQSLESERCNRSILSDEGHAIGNGSETGKIDILSYNFFITLSSKNGISSFFLHRLRN